MPFVQYRTLQAVCSPRCAIKEAKAKTEKKERQQLAVRKKALKSDDRRHQLKLTQMSFNKLRKLQEYKWFADRGLQPTCISCGKEKGGDSWACGHFKTVAGHSALRFDEKNTYLQHNFRCNSNLSGDINGTATTHGYKQGLINRFGEDEGQAIIDYCESYKEPLNYTCEELISIRKKFSKLIRQLEG